MIMCVGNHRLPITQCQDCIHLATHSVNSWNTPTGVLLATSLDVGVYTRHLQSTHGYSCITQGNLVLYVLETMVTRVVSISSS